MIQLKQFNGSRITPTDDAILYDFFNREQSGLLEGCQVTHLGSNQLHIGAGRGIIRGRAFVVEEETILAQLSSGGEIAGRLLIQVDVDNTESPISFITQAEESLPALTQEDINHDGAVFQLPLATYQVTEILISGLKNVAEYLLGPVSQPEFNGVVHTFPATAALTPSGALELTGDLPADKDGLTVQFVSPAAATDGLQMKFAGSGTLYPILTTGEGKEPIQAGAWDAGVPVILTVSGGSCFFKGGGQGFPPGWNEKGQGIAWDDITKNSPIVQREYGKIEDGLQALPEPDVLPTNNGVGCAFSPDESYLAVATYSSPFIIIYKRNGDTFTKLPNPAVLPTGSAERCTFSPDGSYLVVTHSTSPSLTIYKRAGDTFSKLPNPVGLTTGGMRGCSFSPDGNYLAVAQTGSPYLAIYKRDGDTFTKLPNPANLPKGNGLICNFSPGGNYLAVTHDESPYVTIYKYSGDTFTKLPNPEVLPATYGWGCSFSPDGNYLTLALSTSPYLTIYKRDGDIFTKLPNPANLPKGGGRSCTFSPDGNYLVVGYINSSPFMIIYKREGDIFTKLPDPKVLPTGNGLGVAFSPDEHYLAVAHAVFPYITIYLNEQKTYIHTLNDINKEYFAYAPKGKIGVAKESKPAGELVKATLFPALYNLTNNGNGGN